MSIKGPPTLPPKIRRRSRTIDRVQRAYTIHDSTSKAFTVQLPIVMGDHKTDDVPITKTTMVSFKHEDDAIRMARLLECHKAINKDWPSTIFDENFSLHLYAWENANLILTNDLYITKWNYNMLNEYCVDNMLDIMYIKLMTEKEGGINFKSDLIRLDMDHDFYVNRFTVMLNRE